MAGTLPDLPGYRFKLDEDGSAVYSKHGQSEFRVHSQSELKTLMDFNTDSGFIAPYWRGWTYYYVYFGGESRDVTGILSYVSHNYGPQWAYSTDTTGTDGTWTNCSGNSLSREPNTFKRTITPLTLTNVRGLRLTLQTDYDPSWLLDLYIYGFRPITSVDRLAFWHPTTDNPLPHTALDFGDVATGTTTAPVSFRIKNLSATMTSSGTTVEWGPTDLPTASARVAGVGLSGDGGSTWSTNASLGTLTPGAISNVIQANVTLDESLKFTYRNAWLRTTYTTYAP